MARAKAVNTLTIPDVVVVRKTADKTLNNVNVLENDDHLLMAVGANEVWQIDIFILFYGEPTADIKLGFSYPVDCLLRWGFPSHSGDIFLGIWGYNPPGDAPYLKVQDQTLTTATGNDSTHPTGGHLSIILINGANAGNVNLQWAQVKATVGDTVVLENSCIIAHKLA